LVEVVEKLEGHFQGGGRQNQPKKRRGKRTHLDVQDMRVVGNWRKMRMEGNCVEVRKLNGEIQKSIRTDKENYLKKKCRVLEEQQNYINR